MQRSDSSDKDSDSEAKPVANLLGNLLQRRAGLLDVNFQSIIDKYEALF